MLVNVRCECGAIVAVVPREDASAVPCHDCGRPVNVVVGSPAELTQTPTDFALLEPEPTKYPSYPVPSGRETIERRLDGLVTDILRSVMALTNKLTDEEQEQILTAAEKAMWVRARGGELEQLKERLGEMEHAAALVGQALLRA